MKNAFILILMFASLRCGQQHGQKGPEIKNGNDYESVLMDAYQEDRVDCGIRAIAIAMKFNLNKEDAAVAVVVRCPGSFEEGFWSKGQKYKLTLTSDSSICKDYQIYNDYKDSLPTYYALNVVKSD